MTTACRDAPLTVRTTAQLLTDRFAKSTDGGGACSNLSDYCGGSFQGIINHLDYIQVRSPSTARHDGAPCRSYSCSACVYVSA
jgi:hypothetical protein